ncbi:MAG: hypothetical protein EKK39_02220 [Sphingobacteriales bacterium]|uniref:hypothetical protein n=1 Tax=Hydrotalea flava TaxID=714549 RepID=UPI00082CE1E5|nr:hypothetical protein [Hydrotalea flava]RTL55822.1 MAG: hypothetical protein EKK39_02220 [Sphingobacteriales bacterium]
MKKLLLIIGFVGMLGFVNAKTTVKQNQYLNSIRVSFTDACGQVLSFTVSCNGCSYSDLSQAAANYMTSRAGANGCFR